MFCPPRPFGSHYRNCLRGKKKKKRKFCKAPFLVQRKFCSWKRTSQSLLIGKNFLMVGTTPRKSHILPHIMESQMKYRQENSRITLKTSKSR